MTGEGWGSKGQEFGGLCKAQVSKELGLGFRGLGFRVFGFRVLGFGVSGLGYIIMTRIF